jgi:hypothetical protein
MVAKELADYVKEQRGKRYSDNMLRTVLLTAGYDKATVEEALASQTIQPATSNTSAAPSIAPASTIAQPTQPPSETGNGGKKWGIVIAAVIILFGAGTAFAYFTYFAPSLSSAQVLQNMYTAAPTIKTLTFSGGVTSTIYIQEPTASLSLDPSLASFPTSTTSFITINGESDLSDLTNIKQSSTILVSGDIGNQAFGTTVEAISLGQIYYVKLDNLSIGTSTAPNPLTSMFAFFIGQWFKIDPAEIAQTFMSSQVTNQIAQVQSSTQLTAAEIQQLRTDAMQDQIISVSQALPDATINGEETYHYKLAINMDNLKTFLTTAVGVISSNAPADASSTLSTVQLQAMENSLSDIQVNDLEIWVGTKNFYPYQLTADISEPAPSSSQSQTSSQPLADILMTMQSNNFNQPLTITAPADAKDVATILQGFAAGFGMRSTTKQVQPIQ